MTFPIYEVEIGTCMTPGCHDQAGYGLWPNFCADHAGNLARIRGEFEQEQSDRCHSFKNGRKTVQRPPVCCAVGCDEPRRGGEAFCAVCRAMDVGEDEAA